MPKGNREYSSPMDGNKGYGPKERLRPNAGFRDFPVNYEASKGSPMKGKTGPKRNPMPKTTPRVGGRTKGMPKRGRRG